jgi:hypothetical protein
MNFFKMPPSEKRGYIKIDEPANDEESFYANAHINYFQ